MKKARKVEIPDDRALTVGELEDLKSHAWNSSIWYASNYIKTTGQIKQKLYDKGYPRDEVEVINDDGSTTWVNIVEETVERLVEYSYVDDAAYVSSALRSGIRSGKSLSSLKTKLFQAGIDKNLIEEGIAEISEEDESFEDEALHKTASKLITSRTYLKLEHSDRRNKLVKTLLTKGFQLSAVLEWADEHMDRD